MNARFALTVALTIATASSIAQESGTSPGLLTCAAITDAEERLACFDREMSALQPAAAENVESAPDAPEAAVETEEPATANTPAVVEQTAPVSVPAAAAAATAATVVARDPEPAAESAPVAAPEPVSERPPAAAPAPVADVAPAAEPVPQAVPDDFGLKSDGPISFRARVADYREKPYGELLILLDNGQIWEQKHRDTRFKIDVGDEVEVSEGLISGYRLTGIDNQLTIQITRIR